MIKINNIQIQKCNYRNLNIYKIKIIIINILIISCKVENLALKVSPGTIKFDQIDDNLIYQLGAANNTLSIKLFDKSFFNMMECFHPNITKEEYFQNHSGKFELFFEEYGFDKRDIKRDFNERYLEDFFSVYALYIDSCNCDFLCSCHYNMFNEKNACNNMPVPTYFCQKYVLPIIGKGAIPKQFASILRICRLIYYGHISYRKSEIPRSFIVFILQNKYKIDCKKIYNDIVDIIYKFCIVKKEIYIGNRKLVIDL